VRGKDLRDQRGVEGYVVVAEDAVTKRRGEGGDYLGAAVYGVVAGDKGQRAVSDEVSGDEHQVRGQAIDVANDALKEEGFGVLIQVNIADLNDAIAVKGGWEIGDGDGAMGDVYFMTCDFA
jgi:hypothetical protein